MTKTETTQWINPIEKDELTGIAVMINSLRVLSGDILEDYFYRYDPINKKEDLYACGYEYKRNRAYMDLIFEGICKIDQELKQYGIKI